MNTTIVSRGLRSTVSIRAKSELIGAAWVGGRMAARRLMKAGVDGDTIRQEVAARLIDGFEGDDLGGVGRAEIIGASVRGAEEVLAGR